MKLVVNLIIPDLGNAKQISAFFVSVSLATRDKAHFCTTSGLRTLCGSDNIHEAQKTLPHHKKKKNHRINTRDTNVCLLSTYET